MFHSHISRAHQLVQVPLRFNVCVTLGDASMGAFRMAIERLERGGAVLIDNGAFSAHGRGERMTLERASVIVEVFEHLAARGLDLLYVVAPDVLGDGVATHRLQRAFADRLRALTSRARVIMPVQDLDLGAAVRGWRKTVQRLGPSVVAGLPCPSGRWPPERVRQFALRTKHKRFHFLGGATMANARLAVELGLDATCDSGSAAITARCTPGGFKNFVDSARSVEERLTRASPVAHRCHTLRVRKHRKAVRKVAGLWKLLAMPLDVTGVKADACGRSPSRTGRVVATCRRPPWQVRVPATASAPLRLRWRGSFMTCSRR